MMVSRLLFNLQSVSLGVQHKSSGVSSPDIDVQGLPVWTTRFTRTRTHESIGKKQIGVGAQREEVQAMSASPQPRPTWIRRDTDPLDMSSK